MASAFGHIAVTYAMGKTLNPPWASSRFWIWSVVCCLLPDADVLGLFVGIPYEHVLGHRGITHSIAFAILIGIVVPTLAVPTIPLWSRRYGVLVIYFGLVTLSHGFLDAFTDGGLGIAFFAPFDSTRYFSLGGLSLSRQLDSLNFFHLGVLVYFSANWSGLESR